jgi:hypothetical protein
MNRHARAWLVTCLLASVLAAAMGLGTLHALQGADSIVPVLVSLQRWTPFFWQQDRFGMLVPLLAAPIRDPLWNLVVQGWVMTAAALMAPFLVARLIADEPAVWFAAASVTNVMVLLLPAPDVVFDWLVVQPYALSIALAAGALLASRRATIVSLCLALLLMVLAHWVNIGVAVLAAPLALVQRRRWRGLIVTICAAASGAALTRLSPYHTTAALVPATQWLSGWRQLLVKAAQLFPRPESVGLAALFAIAAAVVACIQARRRSDDYRTRERLSAAALATLVGLTYSLTAGTSRWVQLNLFLPRYVYPSLMMAGLAIGFAAAAALRNAVRPLGSVSAIILVALTIAQYGMPSPARLQSTIDSHLGLFTADIVASGATVIGGNYWQVWPAVFHANLTTFRQGGPMVYGLTYRSTQAMERWRSTASLWMLAAPAGDRMVEDYARRAGFNITPIERHGTVDIYKIAKPGSRPTSRW